MSRMEWWAYLLVAGVVLVASTTQTITGFGFALIAVPVLVTVLDVRDVVVLAGALGLASSALVVRRTHALVPVRTVAVLLVSSFAGLPVGLAVLLLAPEDALRIAVGVASIVMAAALAVGASPGLRGRRGEVVAGLTSGVLNTSTGMNGPPVVLYLQDAGLRPAEFRGALSAFFSFSGVISLAVLAASRVVTLAALGLAAAALPMVFAGNWAGQRLYSRIEREMFRRLVLALLTVTALVAVATSVARVAAD
jgi:uncharacterized membrane protein YfcA